jgi:hypothetical protein
LSLVVALAVRVVVAQAVIVPLLEVNLAVAVRLPNHD